MNSAARNAPAGSQPVKAELWSRIYSRVGSYWKGLVLATLLMAGAAATQPTLAVIMKPLLDDGFAGTKPYYVWALPLAVVGLIFVRGVCNFFSDYLLAWVANNVLLGMRRDMFERLLGLPDADFKRGDTGRLLNRFTIDAGNVTGYATDVITVLVRETLVVIALICVLLYMSWVLTLIILIMLPVSVLIARVFIKRLRRINREMVNMNAELTRVVSEGIDGQRVIKLFDGYEVERGRFDFVSTRLRRFAMRTATADAALTPLTQVCISISVGAVIAVALSQANSGALTVGSFASFMAALAQIFDPIKRLTNLAARMQKMLVSAESVFTLIDQVPEGDTGTRELPEPVRGKVEFRNVTHRFSDADRDTVNDVSFVVEPGQTVALVGRSGSGKTTLVNMLPRFVLADTGAIFVDDVPINDLKLRSLRSHLSLVSQDVVLFDDTIAANVGYGALGQASEQQVRDALAAANLLEFVESLPQGINTPVGENAARLSGGQRQRLAIARALIKNAPILILDEATSALDNESERQVQASLERLMKGRTTLVIAHRLSTVQNADRIIVLDAGKIVEQGPHAQLLAANGLYASLYKMQARDAAPPRAAPRPPATLEPTMSLPAEGNQLVNVVVLLGAAVVAVPVFKRLGLGSVLGYLAAGLVIGPFGIGWFSDPKSILHVAELGVVMFLFIIGLEMQPSRLWKLRGEIFGLGVAQVLVCGALLTVVGLAAGLSGAAAFMAAMGFVLSSTAIVMQILAERDETASAQGQRIVSILLLEDLAIVPLLALVALLAPPGGGEHGDPWLQSAIAIGCILALLAAGRWLLNPLFRLLAAAHAREVMTAAALLVVLGAALVMELGGLSMAMGAFLAGVLLSESTFRHQLEAEVEPFRGILLGLFFLGVGMSLDLAAVAREWQLILAGVVIFMVVKSVGVYVVARVLRASHAEALTRAALLAQGGEFAFVLYGAAAAAGIFDTHLAAVLIAVVIISMALTPLCVLALRWLLPKPAPSMDGVDVAQDLDGCALIVGFGRFGQIVTQAMLARDMKVSILDTDTDAIRAAAKWGVKVYYGDGTRIDMLRTAGAENAKAILICIDNPQSVSHMVKLIKSEFPLVQLVVRAYDRIHSLALAKEGVDYQVRETFESALVFGEAALRAIGVPADEAAEVVADVRKRDTDRFDLEVAGGLFAGRSLLYGNMTGPADGRNDQLDRETAGPASHSEPGAPA